MNTVGVPHSFLLIHYTCIKKTFHMPFGNQSHGGKTRKNPYLVRVFVPIKTTLLMVKSIFSDVFFPKIHITAIPEGLMTHRHQGLQGSRFSSFEKELQDQRGTPRPSIYRWDFPQPSSDFGVPP